MFRKLAAVGIVGVASFIVAGCHQSASTTASSGLPVFPAALEGHQSFELGQLIYLLMPSSGTSVRWDLAVDSPIAWVDNGFVSTDSSTYRRGFARVNVMGKWSTELKQKNDELGWEVRLITTAPAKFGPQEIDIQPGTDGGADMCFGTLFQNCWFDPRPSLESAGITAVPICQYGPNEPNSTHVYQLTAQGKTPIIFLWLQSEGSGGDGASIALLLNGDKKAACAPPNT